MYILTQNLIIYVTELKTAFHLLDKNQDGRVSVSELQHMLKHFGIEVPDNMVVALMQQASATGKIAMKCFLKTALK